MARRGLIDGEERLLRVERWLCLFSFPPRGIQLLAELVRLAGDPQEGVFPGRGTVVAALILAAPEDPDALKALCPWEGFAGPITRRGAGQRRRTVLGLPPPVSLRLNRLIELASAGTGQRLSRTGLVVGLMEIAHKGGRDHVRTLVEQLRSAKAQDAAVADDPPASVLQRKPPRPGPRPLSTA